MVSFTKALPANNTLQLQYFYTQSKVEGWAGPMFYFFQMDPASPYFPATPKARARLRWYPCMAPLARRM